MKSTIPIKKTLFILAVLVLISVIFSRLIPGDVGSKLVSNVLSTTFSDVPSSHPNYDAIDYLLTEKVIEGYSDGTFRPDNLINRAEFTKIITESYFPGQAVGANCFPDVGTEWFAKYVCFNKFRNFITGYPDGTFRPANEINFVETAKILVNLNGALVTLDPEVWYRPYVQNLAAAGAIPLSINSFDQKITRGEMAEMLYRLKIGLSIKSSKTYQQLEEERDSPGNPVRLMIPAIKVDSAVEFVGLTSDGAVGIPKDPDNAAWYNLGPRPGAIGSSVITGHINWYYGATGVFANLHKIEAGDRITVIDDKGATMNFIVRDTRSYDAAANAVDVFYSYDGKAHLNLITCEGVWDSRSGQYTKRLVVFADRE